MNILFAGTVLFMLAVFFVVYACLAMASIADEENEAAYRERMQARTRDVVDRIERDKKKKLLDGAKPPKPNRRVHRDMQNTDHLIEEAELLINPKM